MWNAKERKLVWCTVSSLITQLSYCYKIREFIHQKHRKKIPQRYTWRSEWGYLDNTKLLNFWLCNTEQLNFRHFNTNSKKFSVTVNFIQKEIKTFPKRAMLFYSIYQEVFGRRFPIFSEDFRRFPKTTEGFRRLPKKYRDYQGCPKTTEIFQEESSPLL